MDDDDEMTAEEFDRRVEAGTPVDVIVALARSNQPWRTSISHGGGWSAQRASVVTVDQAEINRVRAAS
ncbi:hypothetical protein [Kribbella sp. NPDC049584]|uniref:hypothetical protein n=1 Tax=Kribbella sp. NPDC049584 TaxID=3154833 RepID=UPI00343EBA1D